MPLRNSSLNNIVCIVMWFLVMYFNYFEMYIHTYTTKEPWTSVLR